MTASSIASAAREVFSTPFLTDAQIVGLQKVDPETTIVQVQTGHTVRSFPSGPPNTKNSMKARKFASSRITTCTIKSGSLVGLSEGPSQVNDSALFRHTSPSLEWSVSGLMRMDNGSSPTPALQIWRSGRLLGEFDMSEAHGEFCTDSFFGWVAWDESQGHFIYQAEAKDPDVKDYGLASSFGETLPKRKNPRIFVIDLKLDAKVLASLPPSDVQPSQVIRTDAAGTVYFIGIKRIPGKKYGLAGCPNRPTSLYRWYYLGEETVPAKRVEFDQAGLEALSSPVYCPAKQSIMMMATYKGGSHDHAMKLCTYSLVDDFFNVLLDGEAEEILAEDGKVIRGLFPSFPLMPKALPSGHLIMMAFNGPNKELIMIDQEAKLRVISNPHESTSGKSWELYQVYGNYVLGSLSNRASPPKLFLGIWDGEDFTWHLVHELTVDTGIVQEVYNVAKNVDIILTKPEGAKPLETPLIIFPHGGPNCSYNTMWSLFGMLAGRLGYALAAINFTGSSGYGQKAIKALEGRVGLVDVEDCLEATDYLVQTVGFSKDRLYLFGGSHGGFLVTHLSTHHNRFGWKAVVAHNPVIDLPTMVMTSDIPDFAFGQMGLSFNLEHNRPPTGTELEAMKRASPSHFVHRVQAPTLLVIGEEDMRVPPSQGKAWYSWLQARGVESDILAFASGHACNIPEAEWVEYTSVFSWFNDHQ